MVRKRKNPRISRLRRGKYCFRDVGTNKKGCVIASNPDSAVSKIQKKLNNWEFISFKKIGRK